MKIQPLADRSGYPALRDHVYLNQASLGLMGEPAVLAMREFLEDIARHGNLRMTDEGEVGYLESLRARGTRLLGCDADRVAILSGASELLGQLPYMIAPASGQEIIAVSTDFPAVTRPWLRWADPSGCEVRFVDDRATHDLTDEIIGAINSQTAGVAVSLVQFATGTVIDVPRLRRATRRVGARLILDVTQAAGVLAIEAGAWEADAVVTSGYKWLGGHGGVALAALSAELLEQAPPLPGWMGTEHPFEFDATRLGFAQGARRWTQSTMAYVSVAGLTAALDELFALGQNRIRQHAEQLSRMLIHRVSGLGWTPFRPAAAQAAAPHLVSLGHIERDAEETASELRRHGVVCGARNGRLRVSFACYNNSEDVETLVGLLTPGASVG
jgi:cysteine desulfurase / selenocysteine lyase